MEKILVPSERQIEWFGREKQIFFHFGMNTFTGREWGDGTEDPQIFNPTELDCRQWIKTIKDAGFTMAIITAKHHDGFCLWPSRYTDHTVANSPYKSGKGDIVKEFTDACKEFGIKAGIYLSPWDRHEKTWGTDEYNDFYVNQLTELMTQYGTIWECWWDGAGSTEAVYDWDRWADVVRKYQPQAVIFGSLGATPHVEVRWIGNEKGTAGDPCWATIDESSLEKEITAELNTGKLGGERFIPAEADVSIRPGWFWHEEQNKEVRTPENLINLWFKSVGKNASLLLNLPPDTRGLVHEKDIESLSKFSEKLKEIFADNIAKKADITSSSGNAKKLCTEGYIPDADDNNPEIILEFEEEKEFNVFTISEDIKYGHRITEYEISAFLDETEKVIYIGHCVGNCHAEHFDKIKTRKLRIKILNSIAQPRLGKFGLYDADEGVFGNEICKSEKGNILKNGLIEKTSDGFSVNMGGIFPFNTVIFRCDGVIKYDLYAFNGTQYELITENITEPECTFDTVNHAYAFMVKITEKSKEAENPQIEAYYR